MSEENKYMDESFKKMSENFKVSYDKSFWNEAKVKLENDSLDNAFRDAAANLTAASGITFPTESIEDVFLDEAFRDGAANVSAEYNPSMWNDFESTEADLQMDDAFVTAAQDIKASYNPAFWSAADEALQAEGLHYEYDSAYWNEARHLLDKADRSVFFAKWAGAAGILLLISFLGLNSNLDFEFVQTQRDYQGNGLAEHTIGGGDLISENTENETQGVTNEANEYHLNFNEEVTDVEQSNDLSNLTEFSMPVNPVIDGSIVENNVAEEDVEQEDEQRNDGVGSENETPIIPLVLNNEVELSERESNTDVLNSDRDNSGELENEAERNEGQNRGSDLTESLIQNESLPIENHPIEVAVVNDISNTVIEETSFEQKTNVERISLNNYTAFQTNKTDFAGLNRVEIIPAIKLKALHTFGLIGGMGISKSYGDSVVAPTNRYYAGFEYLRNGTGRLRNFEFGFNLVVNQLGQKNWKVEHYQKNDYREENLNDEDESSPERYYFEVSIRDLFYAGAGVLVNYKINTRHKIKFGANYDHLIAGRSNLSKIDKGDSEAVIFNNNWGDFWNQIDVLKVNDVRFSLGYEFRINQRFAMQLNTNVGLFDRTIDSEYNEAAIKNVFDREINATLGLKYNIFRKL